MNSKKCLQAVETQDPTGLCGASKDAYDQMVQCACVSMCSAADQCGANACVKMPYTPACLTCIQQKCPMQLMACSQN
jgi:hypothetical protein